MNAAPETPEQYRSRALKLRIFLGAQLLFFAAWGGWLLSSRGADSPEFYLETEPVDPRDLISGTYVALNYAASRPASPECSSGRLGPVFVKFEDRGRTVPIGGVETPVREAVDCRRAAPQEPGWAAASLKGGWRVSAVYGIEKFFLNENDPRKDARSGEVVAKVKIGHGRQLQLLDLVRRDRPAQAGQAAAADDGSGGPVSQ